MKIIRIEAKNRIKRIAAYCRVSTDKEAQQESFDTQVRYYTGLIRKTPGWVMAGIYADEGISGTGTKKRTAFNRMMEDARAGRIDVILTKSISRFARNSVDCNMYVRELRSLNVEVRFEREGISSLDAASEFLFNVIAIVAQEESRSISRNVRWRIEKDFANGKHFMGNNQVMGYDVVNRQLIPNQDAWIIRRIFEDFLTGMTLGMIAKDLDQAGARRLRSEKPFHREIIRYILKNPIYVGDLRLQKEAPLDFLTKRPQKNTEYMTYYVKNDHEGIITRELWDAVQKKLEEETKMRRAGLLPGSGEVHFLYGSLYCGQCGDLLTRRTYGKRGKSYKAWVCRQRYRGKSGNGCKNRSIREKKLLETVNEFLELEVFDEVVYKKQIEYVIVTEGSVEILRKSEECGSGK